MWIHLPSRLCPSVPESVDSNWESGSFFQDCASLLTSRGMPRQPKHWRDAWTTGRLTPLRFGPTLPASTVEDGLDRWISSWAEFRASRSAWPVSARDETTSDGSGPTSGAGFGTYDRDSSSWRTCRDLFGMDYPVSLETWPKRGSLRSGGVSARRMSERPTVESGSLCWPTPVSNDDNKTPEAHMAMKQRMKGGPRNTITSLQVLAQAWPTPTTNDSKNDNPPSQAERNTPPLNVAAAKWPTARATDSKDSRSSVGLCPTLGDAMRHWQTPRSEDVYPASEYPGVDHEANQKWMDEPPPVLSDPPSIWQTPATDSFRSRGGERKDEMGLDQQVRNWATPRATEHKQPHTGKFSPPLTVQVADFFHRDQQTGRGGPRTPNGAVLNPRFVEALMGLPDGMTASTPLEMRSFRSWLATHSQRLRVLLDSTSMVRRTA